WEASMPRGDEQRVATHVGQAGRWTPVARRASLQEGFLLPVTVPGVLQRFEVKTPRQAFSPKGFRCLDLGVARMRSRRLKPLCRKGCLVVSTLKLLLGGSNIFGDCRTEPFEVNVGFG